MMQPQTVLVIEDEKSIADVVIYNLEKENFRVLWERDGRDGLLKAQSVVPDLVVLDLMLPGMDGLQVCRHLKSDSRTQDVRVLMLTARSEETDEIVGFNMGADDYVTKPFRVRPLIHRVKALLRRSETSSSPKDRISLHGIEIDRVQHTATSDGRDLDLTPTEFRLLWTMASQPGRPFSRNELMDTARGEDANALERTIDVHVRSLRKKLDATASVVETVRGVGYRFQRK
ncbi:MAG: response regulator [Planctomycetaceae bacterium]